MTDDASSQQHTARQPLGGWAWAAIIINLLNAVNSTYFFMSIMRVDTYAWLNMNTCAPAIYLFTVSFLILRSDILTGAACLVMFRYGTLALFTFPWDSFYALIPQFSHIFMTICAFSYVFKWRRVLVGKAANTRNLVIALAIGIAIIAALREMHKHFYTTYPQVFEKLVSGKLIPGEDIYS